MRSKTAVTPTTTICCQLIRDYLVARHYPNRTKSKEAFALVGAEWCKYLGRHLDYIASIKEAGAQVPKRTAITNGEWFIVFIDPVDIIEAKTATNADIQIYDGFDAIERDPDAFFCLLSYEHLAPMPEPVKLVEVRDVLGDAEITKMAFGVHLTCHYLESEYAARPHNVVAPLIFIQAKNGRVVAVKPSAENCGADAGIYFDQSEYTAASNELLQQFKTTLGINESVVSVKSFCNTCDIPPTWQVERSRTSSVHLIVTGASEYFLHEHSAHSDCPGHSKDRSGPDWVLSPKIPSVTPQLTMFADGHLALCGHRAVEQVRLVQINVGRHNSTNSPTFRCHIAQFEQYACCRSCCFQEICSAEPSFDLPCGVNGLS